MKDIHEVLRQKELEISRLATEVEALRIAAPLLSDDEAVGEDNNPTSARSVAAWRPVRVPQAVNESPQPAEAPEWKDRGKRWP